MVNFELLEEWMEELESKTVEEIEKPAFVIDDDEKADWALRKIAEEKQEYDRIHDLADNQIRVIEEKVEVAERRFNQRTSYLQSLLGQYFVKVPHKKTKTQETYQLLSGKLVLKLPRVKTNYDKEDLLQFLKDNSYQNYIETEEKAKWGEFKKLLDLSSGTAIIKETGEVVDCITLEDTPMEFKVEV